MVDQANEWLPLITPGTAVDGVGEIYRGRGRAIGKEKDFPQFDYFKAFQSQLKNNLAEVIVSVILSQLPG